MPPRTIADVVEELGTIAPFGKAASWDPVGLQLGDPAAQVTETAVCHEVTEQVVSALEASPVDLLVTYHPLLFDPVRRIVAGPTAAGRALRLLRAGIALAVVHTAFDVTAGGAADALADEMALTGTRGFGALEGAATTKVVVFVPPAAADRVAEAMSRAGAGVVGAYSACSFRTPGTGTFFAGPGSRPVAGRSGERNDEQEIRIEMVAPRRDVDAVVAALVGAHPYEEPAFDVYRVEANQGFVGRVGDLEEAVSPQALARRVGDRLGGVVRLAAAATPIRTVAVVPGSGGSMLALASVQADAIVTGDVAHHAARDALSRGLTVVDPGHAPTERPGVRRLYAAVAALGPCRDLTALDDGPWEEPA
jgi:dinuclear metal center YbgI/SA1388 family protein